MKQLLLLPLVIIISNFSYSQSALENIFKGNTSLNFSDFPVALYNGTPDISIPIMSIPTANQNVKLDFDLQYDLMSNGNVFLSTNQFGDVWKTNIFSTITRKKITQFTDEEYYHYFAQNEFSTRLSSDIFTFNVFGKYGKFQLIREHSTFKIHVIETSDFLDIKLNYQAIPREEGGYINFKILSFILTDKEGMVYVFEDYSQGTHIMKDGKGNEFEVKFTTDFHLTKVIDNKNIELLHYFYPDKDKKSIPSSILIHKMGSLVFDKQGIKDIVTLYNQKGQILKKVKLDYFADGGSTNSPFDLARSLLFTVDIYDTSEQKKQRYRIDYDQRGAMGFGGVNELGVPRENACLPFTIKYATRNKTIRKITSPSGGCTFYDFEPHTFSLPYLNEEELDPTKPSYPAFMSSYEEYPENFTATPLVLSYDANLKRYYFTVQGHYIVDFDSEIVVLGGGFEDEHGNPIEITHRPGIEIRYASNNGLIQKIDQPAACWAYMGFTQQSTTMYIQLEPQYANYYSNVKVIQKSMKPYSQYRYEIAYPGFRIKKVTNFDRDISIASYETNNTEVLPANEITYSYTLFNNDRKSSGIARTGRPTLANIENDLDYIFYKNVRAKTTGLGRIDYEFDKPEEYVFKDSIIRIAPNVNINKYLKNLKKYDNSNTLVEELSYQREYTKLHAADNTNNTSYITQPVISYEKITAHTYAGTTAKKLVTISESTYDTLTRNLTLRKITDVHNNQVFEEAFTFVKKHQTYFPETVKKYKNSQLLNQSAFEYTPVTGNPQVVNLSKSYVAKSTLPLEIDKEITRYDAYGNVLEYKTKTGKVVSQIWGYDGTQLIAELKNVAYNSISAATITAIQTASNAAGYNETNLNTAFTQLRSAHADGFITTYTYKPLVGMTSVTDANGRRESYQYDSFNRLYRVVNHEGQVTKEYQYNTKNQ